MSFTFIVIAKPGQKTDRSISSIIVSCNAHTEIEVILVVGNNPSLQRNQAAVKARGDYLIFLDNDSKLDESYLKELEQSFLFSPEPLAIGGISELEHTGNKIQEAIKCVFANFFGIGPLRFRYNSFGEIRYSDDKELILCNMVIQKNVFLELGGFHSRLYPNEENEFLSRLKSKGKIIHNPNMKVYRLPRKNISDFIKQMFSYGRGRTKHFLVNRNIKTLVYFLPMLFSMYILLLPFNRIDYSWYPVSFYFFISALISIFNFFKIRDFCVACLLPLMFFFCHFFYGLGQFWAFVTFWQLKENNYFYEERIFYSVKELSLFNDNNLNRTNRK